MAAAVWLTAEVAVHHYYGHRAMPYWNALMMLVVFLSVVLVLSNLHEILVTLDRRVIARTAQLKDEMMKRHQAELGQLRAQRLAVVGSMAAQMAHEVRNPMGSISLNMDMLSHEVASLSANGSHSPEEARLLLAQMEQEFGRIDAVINDYLTFARLPKVVPRLHRLHDFLDEKLALTTPELTAAHVRLVKDFDPAIGFINVDPTQMWQVLLNLVRNAREAMPDGGELKVSTHQEGDEIHISVSDTGCGITEDDIAEVFTPFFITKGKGTGLGLALSMQIVTEHGGRLTCQSALENGTTFTISLPASKNQDPIQSKSGIKSTNLKLHQTHELQINHSPA